MKANDQGSDGNQQEIERAAPICRTAFGTALRVGSAWALAAAALTFAQRVPTNDPPQYGPYNGVFVAGGLGLRTPLQNPHDSVLLPDAPWTISCWIKLAEPVRGHELLAGLGDVTGEYPRFLALSPGKVSLWMGEGNEVSAAVAPAPGQWHLVTATFDGVRVHLFYDGKPVASGAPTLGTATPVLQMAPPSITPSQTQHFGGEIASFLLRRQALTDREVRQLADDPPHFAVLSFEEGSKPWAVQSRAWAGYRAPQDPATLPLGRAPASLPKRLDRPPVGDSLVPVEAGKWAFSDGWTLREAPKVDASPQQLAVPAYAGSDWMRATVPGTVLTTLIDDGIYPDPNYGLNNLQIPETLNKQDYWYRNVFSMPTPMQTQLGASGKHVELTFEGINYKAEMWFNGSLLGTTKGAFRRASFDVTTLLKPGAKNVLAVRISPPPHPGIPQEQSVLGGPGENGGQMELDGPTFLATEGWDWIPAVRDRDTGIWQPVTLQLTGALKLGDAHVTTTFDHHDTTRASIEIDVPVTNLSDAPIEATVNGTIEDRTVQKRVTVPPGASVVRLLPAEFAELRLEHPRLWWPNGYGKPELYSLKLEVQVGAETSDSRTLRFGVREVSYELSLLDAKGHLRRVEFTPGNAPQAATPIVDVSHEGMREIPSADAAALGVPEEKRGEYQYLSVVSSLAAGAESSPAIEPVSDTGPAPYLVIKVNGVRIAARGGNWGMDDSRKRVSRAHLEPFFRLNRDANLNIIRNWVGQNTEEVFYDLADEYGMLIWNDFWESTQNYNLEAEDPQLFLDNASDTIQHFRNHPSIALWCGRNEGVPQPILNLGLEQLVRTLDGTRFYSPSSNQVNLQQSGPYSYQPPALYYTTLNRGFSVETGTPSMSTLESFESTTPKEDQWPINDTWAYHDWHESGNGRVAPFNAELEAEFGAPTGLEDFERKAQMLNYVDHRAIFEGMNANLWSPNSGRLLWMTQPAWPSTMWQILSSDYDTQASFYGTKKACEPLHVQLNLATNQVDIVNTTNLAMTGLTISAKVFSLDDALLLQHEEKRNAGADSLTHGFQLELGGLLSQDVVIVQLELRDAGDKIVSKNLYWLAGKSANYRQLTHLAVVPMKIKATAVASPGKDETTLTVQLTNTGKVVSLENKLTLFGPDKARVLPVYYSDNYVSLRPGETQTIEVTYATAAAKGHVQLALRGWNAAPQTLSVDAGR